MRNMIARSPYYSSHKVANDKARRATFRSRPRQEHARVEERLGAGLAIIAAMKTRSLDILEKSQLPAAQAHAILKVMEMEIAAGHEALASKLDVLEVKAELMSKFAELEAKLYKVEGTLSRWVLTCIIGQTAVLAGLGYFVLEHFRR